MRQTLLKLKQKPVLLVEVGWPNEHPHWPEQLQEFQWLFDNGYNPINFDNMKNTQDVFFIPTT